MQSRQTIGMGALVMAVWMMASCSATPEIIETPSRPTPPPVPEPSSDHAATPSTFAWSAPTIVAESDRRWTGLAVADDGRLIVNYPRWSDDVPISVAVLDAQGKPTPFPNADWNRWAPGDDPAARWVCVQSVVVDARGDLWVLDPGNPKFAGVIEGAPKLVRFDLSTPDADPKQVIRFAAPQITAQSYLNDIRFDREREVAYMTDSGDGALLVVDLKTGTARRLLDGHRSVEAESTTLTIGGKPFATPVHADGIALDIEGGWLYYQALTGRTLYRVPTRALLDPYATDGAIAEQLTVVGKTGASDGLLFHQGRVWLTSLELDAIRTVGGPSEEPLVVARDPRIAWPDSFAAGPDGAVYFTTAQIHLGDAVTEPFRIWRIPPAP
ncbi:MAG: L-dopachrome tautomerase-related protein [Myxococcota bacterium]